MCVLNRAVANGPVGPAMAGPIIEPVIFFFYNFFFFFIFFPGGLILEPVMFPVVLIQSRHKRF